MEEGKKTPMFISMNDDAPFMMAGVYSIWKNDAGEEHPSFSVITTVANEFMQSIHSRMPVILPEAEFERWLDRGFNDTSALKELLCPAPSHLMKAYAVTPRVNNSRYQEADCVSAVTL